MLWLPALLASGLLVASPAPGASAPQMHFDRHLRVSSVCFPARDPAGAAVELYGRRYSDRPANVKTPAIVLIHGAASSDATWDLSPKWSAARALAAAGYVVFAYDRLGFAASGISSARLSGNSITTAVQRGLLHEVVAEIHAGSYRPATAGGCARPDRRATLGSRSVVVIGHSSGAWVVAGYPGEYHDVAAMVQADISATAAAPVAPGGSFTPAPGRPDYYQFFQTRQQCQTFNAYPPGEVAYVLRTACTPPFLLTPFGEVTDLGHTLTDDARYIARIGPRIPILLTSGDHDTTESEAAARMDLAYYRAHCRCSVSQFFVPSSGHLFMAHRSLPTWIAHVVSWLSGHGIRPAAG